MSLLPLKDLRYLKNREITFEVMEDGEQKGIVLRNLPLPLGRFDAEMADVLIVLPSGYPDTPPDMFFIAPWLKLKSSQCYPRRAESSFNFGGRNWQRWSRHNNQWRQGTDGIWTMLKRVETALQEAA